MPVTSAHRSGVRAGQESRDKGLQPRQQEAAGGSPGHGISRGTGSGLAPQQHHPFLGRPQGLGPHPCPPIPQQSSEGLLCASMSPVALPYPQAGPNLQLKCPERRLESQEEEGLAYASHPTPLPPALLVLGGGESDSSQKHSSECLHFFPISLLKKLSLRISWQLLSLKEGGFRNDKCKQPGQATHPTANLPSSSPSLEAEGRRSWAQPMARVWQLGP